MANEDKQKALDAAILKLEKDFGKGTVMKLGDAGANVSVETVPTGSLSLDIALGLGGVPKGRVIEVYGPESSGKTTVTLHMIAEVQKRGGIAGFIDAEHALDPVYAKNIGVNIDELYISQPDSGDQALEIAETMVRSGAMDIIVIDSVAALVPKQEIEGDMGDSHVGLQARLMSQALRKLTPVISKSNCVVIFINQLREKVGVMFGNPETTTGGRALKFYASVRMDVRRIETLKQNGEMVGNRTRIKIVKNKIAPPFKEAEFDIMFGKGISKEGDILDLATKLDLVNKSGAWYAYNGDKIGQGRENAKIDGQFAFVLYKGELSRYHIAQDTEVDERLVSQILSEIVLKRAKLRAMHLLTDMDRTESQLRTKLKQGLYPDDIIEQAMAYVKSFGYVEDENYARRFVLSRQNSKSKKEIYASLCQKGVAKETIDKVMEECYEMEEERGAIQKILEKKRFCAEKATEAEKAKICGYLLRKGFRYEDIRQVIQVSEWNT